MQQRIVIVDDFTERTALMARALRDSGYGVLTVQAHSEEELWENLRRLRPDFLVIGDDLIIDLHRGEGPLKEIKIAC